MEQDKNEMRQPGTDALKAPDEISGRVPEAPQPTSAPQDISQVDQQEGQMNNGELGGNFNTGGTDADTA